MKIFFSCIVLLLFTVSFAQKYSFINYSIESGLPQSQVSSFIQDDNGYLWVGTMGGLAKFNGQSFFTYTTKSNLLNNRISSLSYNNDSLFAGHEGGFSIGYNSDFTPFRFEEKDKNVLTSKVLSFNGKIIAFTNGSGYYSLEDGILTHTQFESSDKNRIRTALIHKKQLYIATRNGLLKSQDGNHFTPVKGTSGLNISGLIIYDENHLFFTTFDSEAGLINLKTHQIRFVSIQKEVYGLRNCFKDSKKQVWIPHLEGIILVDEYLNPSYINGNSGLNYNNINTVYEDKNQTIWIGSEGKGIFKFSGNHIRRYNFENESKSDLILSSLVVNDNSFYGTYDAGIIIQNNRTKATQLIEAKNNPVWTLALTKNKEILVGSENGLFQINPERNALLPVKIDSFELSSKKVTCILSQNNNSFIGGNFGLAIYRNGRVTSFFPAAKFNLLTIRSLAFYNNELYLGCDNGLFILKSDKFIRVLDFSNKINSLKVDKRNRIWIGTEDGLYIYDQNNIYPINLSDRSASNIINFINQNNNYLIFGTNDGIYYTDPEQETFIFKHIGLEEGISNLETNINSSFVDTYNNIIFGTVSGLNVLNINKLEDNYIIRSPHIIIKNIAVNFATINKDPKDYKVEYDQKGAISAIVLPYNKNNILIELDGITLKDYQSLNYQYWIEGLENTWSARFKNPQINITNLPYGEYKINIRGVLNNNLYSNIITIKVTINPPFYLRLWFILLVMVFIVGNILFFIRQRVQRERNKSRQEKLEIRNRLNQLEQQSLNASMNRHFIFNALNSIQYFINTQDKYSANKYLTNFAKLIRKNLDSSTENDNLVSLDEEVERLRLYLDLECMRFKNRFTYEIDDDEVITDNYQVPAMLLQPFVENSILHGILPNEKKKGKITISINDFQNHIEIRIKDNGIGIDQSLKNKGINSGAHKSKGMEISTKRINLLKQFYNKDFELIGPFQTSSEDGLISGTMVLIKIPKENL